MSLEFDDITTFGQFVEVCNKIFEPIRGSCNQCHKETLCSMVTAEDYVVGWFCTLCVLNTIK
jgi:hypothetical protein